MKATSSGKRLNTLVMFLLLGLAGCMSSSQKGCQVACTNNCTSTNTPPPPLFLYATSINQILTFTIDQSSGALSTPPLVTAGPNSSIGIAASGLGQLYVSDFQNDAVDGFSIGSSGGLTALATSPFSLQGTPPGAGGLSALVNGQYLYATDLNAGAVAGFTYNSASGALTPVPGSPFAAGNTPMQAVQAATFLYVSNLNDPAGAISAFAIGQNGSLSPIAGSPFPTGASGSYPGPSAMVVGNAESVLYVALTGTANANNQIAAFSINPTTGYLTALPQSPFTTGNAPSQMAYVTYGPQSFLYAANVQDATISAFTADPNSGVLTQVNGSPFAAGTSVGALAVGPPGSYFLYQADPEAEAVRAYTIDPGTGALSPLAGSPFAAGAAPSLLTVTSP